MVAQEFRFLSLEHLPHTLVVAVAVLELISTTCPQMRLALATLRLLAMAEAVVVEPGVNALILQRVELQIPAEEVVVQV
jgi:hypothetical protein